MELISHAAAVARLTVALHPREGLLDRREILESILPYGMVALFTVNPPTAQPISPLVAGTYVDVLVGLGERAGTVSQGLFVLGVAPEGLTLLERASEVERLAHAYTLPHVAHVLRHDDDVTMEEVVLESLPQLPMTATAPAPTALEGYLSLRPARRMRGFPVHGIGARPGDTVDLVSGERVVMTGATVIAIDEASMLIHVTYDEALGLTFHLQKTGPLTARPQR